MRAFLQLLHTGSQGMSMIVVALLALSLAGCEGLQAIGEGNAITISDVWNTPQLLPEPINGPAWEDSPSISPDGKTLFFTRGKDRNVDTYVSRKTGAGWSAPEAVNEINIATFPTAGPHTQDGKTLYFASIRPGGLGLADIYVCTYVDGQWTDVRNLGAPVNTDQMESEPYISPDGNTLYFASNRGGTADIWVARKSGGEWSEVEKLPGPVNTAGEETQPFVTADGKQLYFMAVNREGIPGPAIFRSQREGNRWGKPGVVISGMVGEPTLTSDNRYLYFVHIQRSGLRLIDGEIMVSQRKELPGSE